MGDAGYNVDLITAEDIQALTAYIPYFESEVKFGKYAEVIDGAIGCSILDKKASAFVKDCYDHHFVQNFDWGKWSEENQELAHRGEGVESLNLEGLGKLLMTHCRAHRFCDGHLLSVMENGQILRVLKRLKGIMAIFRPSNEQVQRYLKNWDSLENYVLQESSLRKLFTETYPKNIEMDDVLIKVCSLNDFYSTNIYSPFTVAKHIVELNIDERLKQCDLKLVNDIANVKVNRKKTINFYSFATKYCSHHMPEDYPIYDSYVEKMLMHFKKEEVFYEFTKADLKHYPIYHKVLMQFRTFYKLESFTLKQIDKYLWQAGKDYFPRTY